MLSVYVPQGSTLERIVVEPGEAPPENAVWIDMVTPSVQEDRTVEQLIGIAVPTREEMQEIEVSSRLYVENGARYMTATLMCQSDTVTPKTTAVTFILAGHRLVRCAMTTRGHLRSSNTSSDDHVLLRSPAKTY